jgi:DNA replication and repair protein RecF
VIVTHVTLQDFRSYARAELDLGEGVTVLIGRNGVGKTNVVEALGYLSTQDSHRVANDAPLIRFGAERGTIAVRVLRGTQKTDVELELIPGRANRTRINRSNPIRALQP